MINPSCAKALSLPQREIYDTDEGVPCWEFLYEKISNVLGARLLGMKLSDDIVYTDSTLIVNDKDMADEDFGTYIERYLMEGGGDSYYSELYKELSSIVACYDFAIQDDNFIEYATDEDDADYQEMLNGISDFIVHLFERDGVNDVDALDFSKAYPSISEMVRYIYAEDPYFESSTGIHLTILRSEKIGAFLEGKIHTSDDGLLNKACQVLCESFGPHVVNGAWWGYMFTGVSKDNCMYYDEAPLIFDDRMAPAISVIKELLP